MSSETVTVYIAGVLPGHKSFDAPIVASAQARKTAKVYVVDGGTTFNSLTDYRTQIPHRELSPSRLAAVEKYLARCEVRVNAAAAALAKAHQARGAAIALLDFEKANPQ